METLESLYTVEPEEKAIWGKHWCGPDKFEHSEDTLIAEIPAKSCGQNVDVYCGAMPSRFYTIKVETHRKDGSGEFRQGYKITTGSGYNTDQLAAQIATAIADGMLNITPKSND